MSLAYVQEKLEKTVGELAANPDPFPERLTEALSDHYLQAEDYIHAMPQAWQARYREMWERITVPDTTPDGVTYGRIRDDLTLEECIEIASVVVELSTEATERYALEQAGVALPEADDL